MIMLRAFAPREKCRAKACEQLHDHPVYKMDGALFGGVFKLDGPI